MIILDTNVVSALMMATPDAVAAAWLNGQMRISIWTTSITVFEIRYGLDSMTHGHRRERQEAEFDNLLRNDLQGRVLNFDHAAAEESATLMAVRKRAGRTIDFRDTMIAGIALANNATLATRNMRYFSDLRVPVINPWQA